MSKYIKQDDIFELVRTGVLVSNRNFESVCKHIGSLPTIEVSEDAISRANLIKSFLTDCECESREEAGAVTLKLEDMLELIEDAPRFLRQRGKEQTMSRWIDNLLYKIRKRRFCKLNRWFCPDCIYHDFIFEGAIFRGNNCRFPRKGVANDTSIRL